jgi:hypothetical protein
MTPAPTSGSTTKASLDTYQKALALNLDSVRYGTFAEIGAGQETATWFFHVGGAAGTVAKTMSAYDMKVSDAIYGKSGRYVSDARLIAMLDHEYELLVERLGEGRGAKSTFFAFANTVAARNFQGTNECHGWVGVRFQTEPFGPPNQICLHFNLGDKTNLLQQEAVGILGVNLLYAIFHDLSNADRFLISLHQNLTLERLEVDWIDCTGPALKDFDEQALSLKLLTLGLAAAVMFEPGGKPCLPTDVLHNRPVIILRSRLHGHTDTQQQLLNGACSHFPKLNPDTKKSALSLLEVSIHDLFDKPDSTYSELSARMGALKALSSHVMLSRFEETYRLTSYLRRATPAPLVFVLGVSSLVRLLEERFYKSTEGGVLEGLGRFFSPEVKAYVSPMSLAAFREHLESQEQTDFSRWSFGSTTIVTLENIVDLMPNSQFSHLLRFLMASGCLVALEA